MRIVSKILAKFILSLPHAWKDYIRHFLFISDSYEFYNYQPDVSLSCMSSNVELQFLPRRKHFTTYMHSYAQVSDDDYISRRVWNEKPLSPKYIVNRLQNEMETYNREFCMVL